MSERNISTKRRKAFTHLELKERECIERWLKEKKPVSQIAIDLDRSPSTIYREINRGTVTQIKNNVSRKPYEVYYSDVGQNLYDSNRQNSHRKKYNFSKKFFESLLEAKTQGAFTGKRRTHSLKTFVNVYKLINPLEKVPTFKTLYRYVASGDFFINKTDLPVMYRLAPRKNKHSKPKGTNKRVLGKSISDRDEDILLRQTFGHWEADLVLGKIYKDESCLLTLVERYSRYGIAIKLDSKDSLAAFKAIQKVVEVNKELFKTITFDNGSEFAKMSELGIETYFCHAYAAWEKGTNENYNKLIREFFPKGRSFNEITQEKIDEAINCINLRYREVLDYRTATAVFSENIKNIA